MENWKVIEGFNGYEVSDMGRVRNKKTGYVLKASPKGKGDYYQVGLMGEDGKQHWLLVSRLVAIAFIPNPDNLPEVNHIREFDKEDNSVFNLCWMNHKDNINYGTRNQRASETLRSSEQKCKGVYCPELDMTFRSQSEASEYVGCCQSEISKCLYGKKQHAGKHPETGEVLTWQAV